MRRKRKGGFTLVELIVVITIILILAAVLVPALMRYIDRSKEAVCRSNEATLKTELAAELTESMAEGKSMTEAELQALADASGAHCPSGGTYSVQLTAGDDGFDAVEVTCSIHDDGTNGGGGMPDTNVISKGLLKDFTDYIRGYTGGRNDNNSIRTAFYNNNGGKWPTLTVNGESYSVQPFYRKDESAADLTGQVWLYATKDYDDCTNGSWNVQMVYNPMDSKWYQATNYNGEPGSKASITFNSVEALNEAVTNGKHSNGKAKWVEVTEYTESE